MDYRKTVMGNDFSCCRLIFGEADGLPGLTVDQAAAPVIEDSARVLAWDVTPETAEGLYTGEAKVSFPVPEDFNTDMLGAFVVNADGSVAKLTGEYANGCYTYTCPHTCCLSILLNKISKERIYVRSFFYVISPDFTA